MKWKEERFNFLHEVHNYITVYIDGINFEVVCIADVLKFCLFKIRN